MHIRNWILNLLDLKKRRSAVQTLASARGHIVEASRIFREIRDGYANLLCRTVVLEREGATPQEQIECGNTFGQLGQWAGKWRDEADKIQINFTLNLRKTPENDAFLRRALSCLERLQRRADQWAAEGNRWGAEIGPSLRGLDSRILDLKTWNKMTGVEFEYFIIGKLRKQGFAAQGTKASGDGGIDIVAVWQGGQSKDGWLIANPIHGRTYLIQCKRYEAQHTIGQPILREFYGAMKGADASAKGIFITTSRFTDSAVEYATRMGIQLVDGPTLDSILSRLEQEA